MSDRFATCLQETLRWEGNFSNDAYDPGGATMKGVTQRVYDAYRRGEGKPPQSVRGISDFELSDIYRRNYWAAVRADELPAGVDLATWDWCVNSGPTPAIRGLQRALGVKVDGHIGAATIAAAREADPLTTIHGLMDARRAFLRSLPTFWRFGPGWMNRCNGVESTALAAVGHSAPARLAAAQPLFDQDQQSATQGRATVEDDNAPWNTTVTAGAGGGGALTYALTDSVSKAGSLDPKAVALAILSNPMFWMAVAGLVSAAYAYYWHKRHASR